jgi:hypothetical protein
MEGAATLIDPRDQRSISAHSKKRHTEWMEKWKLLVK